MHFKVCLNGPPNIQPPNCFGFILGVCTIEAAGVDGNTRCDGPHFTAVTPSPLPSSVCDLFLDE